jgi:DNA repair exonuclease SbcCD ATPase subunit
MECRRLVLENIGCFSEKSFDLSSLTVVYGENRSGKSTLAYALFFALFGEHLNPVLSYKDLCQKGQKSGSATLEFEQAGERYALLHGIDRMPRLYKWDESQWVSLSVNDLQALKEHIPVSLEIASLTSFFREGELIYFLQDIPKYNKTLLENFIGIDDALILRSKFKKALAKAREVRKSIQDNLPKREPDPLSIELTQRQLAQAEKEFQNINAEYRSALETKPRDPTVFKLLNQQYDQKKKTRENLSRLRENYPPIAELDTLKSSLEKRLQSNDKSDTGPIQQEIGAQTQKIQSLRLRSTRLKSIEGAAACPLCEQEIPDEKLSSLIEDIEKQILGAENEKKSLEKRLTCILDLEKQRAEIRREMDQITQKIQEIRGLEGQIQELTEQIGSLDQDLKGFAPLSSDLKESEAAYGKKDDIETRRIGLQNEIVRHNVALRQQEDLINRMAEGQKNLDQAQRKVLICKAASEALEEAIQSLGQSLLKRVRESIQLWAGYFSFLNEFDIQMTGRELLPMIQARGYQYKLSQMSKSERIFLYLLMKLALGDALGHLGFFVLDDPADGLDAKRKQTLAYLLAEVSRTRQVIVTTNDPVFADFFSSARRINLSE